MVKVLPIQLVLKEDLDFFSNKIFQLAKLAREGLVPEGVAVALTSFDKLSEKNLLKIPLPQDLKKDLGKNQVFFLRGQFFSSPSSVWQALLKIWQNQYKYQQARETKIWLEPLIIMALPEKGWLFKAYFDPFLKEILVESSQKLSQEQLLAVDQLVLKAQKILILPFILEIVQNKKGLAIVDLRPFTDSQPVLSKDPPLVAVKPDRVRSAMKIYLDINNGGSSENIDGLFLSADLPSPEEFLDKVGQRSTPLIFKLFPDSLKKQADFLLLLTKNKNLPPLSVVVGDLHTPSELVKIREKLAALNINWENGFTLWFEAATLENLLNLEQYLDQKINGLIINLDQIHQSLLNYPPGRLAEYAQETAALIPLLSQALEITHQSHLPVLFYGKLILASEIAELMVKKGAWGVISTSPLEADSLSDHFHFLEKRMMKKKVNLD